MNVLDWVLVVLMVVNVVLDVSGKHPLRLPYPFFVTFVISIPLVYKFILAPLFQIRV